MLAANLGDSVYKVDPGSDYFSLLFYMGQVATISWLDGGISLLRGLLAF